MRERTASSRLRRIRPAIRRGEPASRTGSPYAFPGRHASHASPLPGLVRSGVVLRTGGRLRVSGRFLAHAERAVAQATLRGAPDLTLALESALRASGHRADVPESARFIADFLAERGQLGTLRPVFGAFPTGVVA